jgi:ribonuclease T2
VIRANLCMTPSVQLLQHEYAKHGTCMGISPARYFADASRLYASVRYPDMDALSRRRGLTVGQFAVAFARANRGMTPQMVKVATTKGGWLEEVRVCMDTRYRYRTCPPRPGAANSAPLKIWRGSR